MPRCMLASRSATAARRNHSMASPNSGTTPRNAAREAKRARQAGRELLEDERNFIDLPNSPIWYGEEREVVGEAGH
jgi:hypothetical protein